MINDGYESAIRLAREFMAEGAYNAADDVLYKALIGTSSPSVGAFGEAFSAMREALELLAAVLEMLRASAEKSGAYSDFSAWHRASAADIGEILTAVRRALALARGVT